jgi:hypothetical protein
MTTSGFLIKTPEQTQPADALDEMLNLAGNRLLLAYGGVRYASDTEQDYEKLRQWLVAATDRHLTLIFGVWGKYKEVDASYIGETISHEGKRLSFVPKEGQIDEMKATLKKIFDFSKLPDEIVDRVHVYGIANFHPKVMYLSRKDVMKGKDEYPVALQFGSSNFTGAARRKADLFQYEMDLFLRWDQPEHRTLITSFVTQWQALHAATRKYDADEFNMDLFFETFEQALVNNNGAKWKQYIESLSSK